MAAMAFDFISAYCSRYNRRNVDEQPPTLSRRKRLVILSCILPPAVALHAYLIWLGGGWRIFALVEGGMGVFLALLMRDLKRLS